MSPSPGTLTLTTELSSTALDPALVGKLADLELVTVGELLRYVPRRYLARGDTADTEAPEAGSWVNLVGHVTRAEMIPMKRKPGSFLKVVVNDGRRNYEVTFFNARWMKKRLLPGTKMALAGTVKYFRDQIQLTHPEWLILPDAFDESVTGSSMLTELYAEQSQSDPGHVATAEDLDHFSREIVPMYPATKNVQTWEIWRAIRTVLDQLGPTDDALTDEQRTVRGLMTSDEAIRKIHLPDTQAEIAAATRRLKFDEALAVQTALAQNRIAAGTESAHACPHVPGGLEDQLLASLPFELTDGQRAVVAEIAEDIGRVHPMNRLLQGEVGSGKTLVSLLAMLRVVDNGHQCAILAPTEVLAAQHHRTVLTMLGPLALGGQLGAADGATQVALLTGSQRTADRRQTLLDIVTGQAGIVIGTHALLEENVEFFDLGMVVVDEQHRFGVEQRDVLRAKGRVNRPHFLVMTATPIPRTVAMITFGDLETSTLVELPRGRQPITTNVVPMSKPVWVERVWERAAEEVAQGRQVYVVCTRIGDEKSNQGAPEISVLDQFEELTAAGPLSGRTIDFLHGRMPAEEKTEVMDRFTRGEVDVLVSTTVIEVGVDVPNATMMVIVNAERFGVSQLHQLRGRVGRGRHAGLCLLMTTAADGTGARARLDAVARSTDGFELARIDLEARREGDVLGAAQSGGASSLHFLSLLDDADVIEDARELATQIVLADLPLAEHPALDALVDSILLPSKLGYLDKS
ncbi:ATP-dependent DNA helicase RecG [Gordonia hirsuta DSM 44140 = NBRC 16056]|uniref:ATP-dependent DNA helicase RecG n=1 Tax=Gordonia hirsuta DSM 44140 = NBRC 16056 TaxID=1121927 RepID=L7LB14_9ACTN|nr:ATP-dependent DNA helicase RecG [Gordonia hirsuta]GAC57228.1 ATP-dependent DNA helicase RecG [Gordonia hirsuta DSM 44140 = NBRC 16056]